MPEKETLERAREDAREGKSASTQAGEFVRQEIHHLREGKHGARSTKQAIAIGLSEARRAGVKVGTPKSGGAATRRKAEQDTRAGTRGKSSRKSTKRSRASSAALKREGKSAGSKRALSRQAKSTARKRGAAARSASARKAARTRKTTSSGGRKRSR